MNRWMYLEPHCHIGPYIVGSLTAFVYVKRGSMRIHPVSAGVVKDCVGSYGAARDTFCGAADNNEA